MPTSNYPNGFTNGLTIREQPLVDTQNADGNVFWVDSVKGSNNNKGTFKQPFATIDYAIGRCTANQGDKIYVAAGHLETITTAAGINCDIAGISIIGLGNKLNKPQIYFTTSTAASFAVNASNVLLKNLTFVCNIAAQAIQLDINSNGCTVEFCNFREASNRPVYCIDINGGASNACADTTITNCEFQFSDVGTLNACINLGEVCEHLRITNCNMFGKFTEGGIYNPVTPVLTQVVIGECSIRNNQTGIPGINILSNTEGILRNIYIYSDAFATAIDPGAMYCFQTYSVSAVDKNARLNPVLET